MNQSIYNRGLSEDFLNEFKTGTLKPILEYVLNDQTLDFQIRADYVNIYYRGGNILKISKSSSTPAKIIFEFDNKYQKAIDSIIKGIGQVNPDGNDWFNYFPRAKQVMDFYFSANKKEEREFQQLVARENNYSKVSNATDYFIVDIEYDNRKNARFDLVAIEWLSQSSARKLQSYKPKLTIIEMKAGDGAHSGSSGLQKHIDDISGFISSQSDVELFKREMLLVFNQKRELGLIPCLSYSQNRNVIRELDAEIDALFLIANHDPESTILKREANKAAGFKIMLCQANYMGYGLFKDCCKQI